MAVYGDQDINIFIFIIAYVSCIYLFALQRLGCVVDVSLIG